MIDIRELSKSFDGKPVLERLSLTVQAGETMVILMQQHNMKEEGILYPMIDSQMGPDVEALIGEAQHFDMP